MVVEEGGCFGWLVTLCSMTNHVLIAGSFSVHGLLYQASQNMFPSDHSLLVWTFSIQMALQLLTGIFAGALIERFGSQYVGMAGGLLVAVGHTAAAFADILPLFILSYGFIAGVGFGLMQLPAIVIVQQYFIRQRALAVGIASAGAGMGSFMWPAAVRWLLQLYGLRGTILLMGAIFLHAVPFAALYIPPQSHRRRGRGDPRMQTVLVVGSDTRVMDSSVTGSLSVLKASSMMDLMVDQGIHSHPQKLDLRHAIVQNQLENHRSLQHLDLYHNKHISTATDTDCEKADENLLVVKGNTPEKENKCYILEKKQSYETRSLMNVYQVSDSNVDTNKTAFCDSSKRTKENSDLNTDTKNISQNGISDCHNLKKEYNRLQQKSKELADFFGLTLLNTPTVWLLLMGFFFQTLGMLTPTFLLPARLDSVMDSSSVALLVGIIGITDTMGRLLFGALGSLTGVSPLLMFTVLSALAGGSSILSTVFRDTFVWMAVYTSVYGFFMGGMTCNQSMVVVQLLGIEQLPKAYGLYMLFGGMGFLLSNPLLVSVYEHTNNYNASFYVGGSFQLLNTATYTLMACLYKKHTSASQEKLTDSTDC